MPITLNSYECLKCGRYYALIMVGVMPQMWQMLCHNYNFLVIPPDSLGYPRHTLWSLKAYLGIPNREFKI